jgi:PAS domain S-box-containing protein
MRPRSADRFGIVAVVLLALALRRDKARSHDPDPVSKAVLVDGMHGLRCQVQPHGSNVYRGLTRSSIGDECTSNLVHPMLREVGKSTSFVSWQGGTVRSTLISYALAIAALVAAVLLRWLLDPLMGDALPLVTLFGAVAAAVWAGGPRPAIVVGILGYIACAYLFIEPRGQLGIDGVGNAVALVAYLFTASLIIGFGEAMRISQIQASQRREVLRVTLRSIGDAVITTDIEGRITYMNEVAESLTGWAHQDARGKPLNTVFRIVNEETRRPVEDPATRALRDGVVVGLANHTVLIRKDGTELPIDDSAAPIRSELGQVSGCVLIFRDVTAQRRSEQEKAGQLLTARLLASIVESSDDAIISKSLDGVIQSWNAAAERLFGYAAEQAVGRHISLIIPSERIAEEDQIIARLKVGQRIEHFETERLRCDGQRILVSLTISPIKNEAGVVVGASKIVRDVTRQRQVEERGRQLLAEAAAANAKFRAIFDQGALFAGIMDVDGTILEPNRMSWEGCGYTREQIAGRPFWEGPWWTRSPALVEQIKAAFAHAAAGQTFRAELPYFLADGSERMADLTIQPIRDETGRVLFLALTGTDITDRKLAESDREKLVTLVENSTDFIGMCDLRGIPFFVNRAGLEMVGLDDIEQARRTPVQDFFFPEDQPRIMGEFFPAVLERGHGELEVRFRHFKTGEARWMAYKVLTLTGAAGQPLALATVSQDVTERKRLEDNLRRLAADLSEADRRKDEFLAMLAHELRNPLAPLCNMLEVLKRAGGDGEMLQRARDTMERQLGQMVRLVDDLLDLNRITRDRLELRQSRVELSSVIHQAVEASRPFADSAGHELQVVLPAEPIHLHADPARLAQVFGNLLNNSCKYTAPGGTIRVTVERLGSDVVVTVKDTGIGIPSDKLDSIFDMFTQVDRSLERSQGGLGIGLTLVKRLVEMHGGSIAARSAGEGQGSEFVVRLPILSGASKKVTLEPTAAQELSRTHRILVVDDNKDSAVSLAMLLKITGNETYTAHDGVQAIEAVEKHRPEVVLLDIGLPGLSGHDVCRRIREQSWGKDLVVIALTGWGQEEDLRKSQEAGFDGHLVKPVDYVALVELLSSLAPAGSAS